ncbi:MAG: hypothetical protein ACXWXT_11780 [Candidatus Binatia bacterium]
MNINYTVTIAKLTALALANPAIGQAQTKERAKLIEDAKKEGKVMVYVSSNASDARALEAAFEKKYPFVNMEFYSSGKDALLTRYLLEARTGANQFSSSLSLATLSVFPPDNAMPYSWLLRLTDFPRAIKNITLLPAAWGEKNSVTSSSKNVRPEAPRPWA